MIKEITSFIVLMGLCGLLPGCGQAKQPEADNGQQKRISVHVMPVVTHEVSFPIHAAGMLALKETAKLSFKTGGIINAIYVDEGATVASGQLLAKLNLAEINAQVHKAQSAFQKAVRDAERVRKLYKDDVAPLQQLEDAETALEIARSDLNIAEFNRRHSAIYAPARGRILKRFAEAGELIAPFVPVFVFASTEKNWIIRFGVTDKDIVDISLGDPAEITFDVYPDTVFKARVSEIAQTADPYTGTFEVELSIQNQAERKLISGFIGSVEVFPLKKEEVAFIPLNAVVEVRDKQSFVFTVDDDWARARKVPVTIVKILDEHVAVQLGEQKIEYIVTVGAYYLEHNSPINVVKEEENSIDYAFVNSE
ncbi:MAG: efflux RND transporter periplasmic adaptor subunit [Spirochaetales bacterium]|nr:efflux RND transporter periplasmic adaptor subunit [Spirochaetales bacterium]